MPAAPMYVHRLEEAIQTLSGMTADWIGRRMLEEILGTGKWTAWRVLKRCGAEEGPGGGLVCRREALIAQLQALQRGRPICSPRSPAASGSSGTWTA